MAKFTTSFASLVEDLGSWHVDFDTHERHVDHNGWRFHEGGRIVQISNMASNPHNRMSLMYNSGCRCAMWSETGLKVILPDGSEVPKAWLLQNYDILIDREHNRIINGDTPYYYSKSTPKSIQYAHPDAMPIGPSFRINMVDAKKRNEARKALADRFAVAVAKFKLAPHGERLVSISLRDLFRDWTAEEEHFVGFKGKEWFNEVTTLFATTPIDVPYLLIERK